MLRRRIGLLKWFTCLSAGVILCWCGRCEAYEPWKGEVTARVNVRKAPGETSPVITQIDQGAKVTVSDEKEGWYKVVVEEDTFGFIGWVYGQYVKIPTALSPTASRLSQLQEKPGGLPSTSTTPAAAHTAPSAGAPNAPPGKGVGSGGAVEKSGSADDKVSSAAGQNEGAHESVVKRAENVSRHAPQAESVERKKADPPEHGMTLVEDRVDSNEMALQKTSQEGDEKGSMSSPAPPSHAAPNSPVMHSEKADTIGGMSETKTRGTDASKKGQVWRAVTGVVVKLAVVAFSCLALLFAYRAWQIANGRKEE